MELEGSGASRPGGDGYHNEDAFLVEEGLGLYVVCDGTSGGPAGEVASQLAAAAIEEFVENADHALDLSGSHASQAVVTRALSYALAAIEDADQRDPELHGLSTTITMLLAHGGHGVVGHRGDSRAYLLRRGSAHQLTADHELTDSAAGSETSAADFDVFRIRLREGDTVVLCTDGAEEVVEDEAIVGAALRLPPRLLARQIVAAAHRRNPASDATAVVVRVCPETEPGWLELSMTPKNTGFGHMLAAA